MTKKIFYISFGLIFVLVSAIAFYFFVFSDTDDASWPEDAEAVELPSSSYSSEQPAYFYGSGNESPLIVSLHQWSADHSNFDPISEMAIKEDWNYIRPDFRGPNNKPDACGSDLAISDIDDAITYAIENGNVDTSQIHIIGASGGGMQL